MFVLPPQSRVLARQFRGGADLRAPEGIYGTMTEERMREGAPTGQGNDIERGRTAEACLALAGAAMQQAESLGPMNEYSGVFAEWAQRLRAQASRLRPRA